MLENVEFTRTFQERWAALDLDESGTLEMEEIYPLLCELVNASGIPFDGLSP